MPELTVEIDGQHVPLRSCEWVFYEPCGCPRGVTDTVRVGAVLYDEETAWRSFFEESTQRKTEAAIKRERARGVTSELMTFERYRAEVNPKLAGKCPHAKAAEAEAAGQTALFEVSA